jgi:hypothetical protein
MSDLSKEVMILIFGERNDLRAYPAPVETEIITKDIFIE